MIRNKHLGNLFALIINYTLDLQLLSSRYPYYKWRLTIPAFEKDERSLSLIFRHCLLDRKLFNGFNLENLYDQGIISADHWQDMQHLSTLTNLRGVDNAFQNHCYFQTEAIDPAVEFPYQIHDGHGITAVEDGQNHLADYQILRMIRTIYDEVPCVTDYSNDEAPIDLGESYICNLDVLYLLSALQKDSLTCAFGLNPTLESKRRLISLVLSLNSINASILEGYAIIFQSRADNLSHWPVVRRLYWAEKEEFLTARLHSAFRQEDSRFRREVTWIKHDGQETSHEKFTARSCDFAYQRYYKAWNTGIVAIRRFLRGILPRNLEQISRLLQVAYAMAMQDPKNPNFRARFASDLDRWRTIVPRGDLSLFDSIAKRYWDKTFDKSQSNAEYSADENLLYLQQLLSGLISDTPLAEISKESNQEDHQTSEDKQRIEDVCNSILNIPNPLPSIEDPRAYAHTRRKLPICWKPAEPIIILMMAGAIFGAIFSFLLSEYFLLFLEVTNMLAPIVFNSFASQSLSSQISSMQSMHFANFEERNLHTLLLYLGLSTASLWQEADNESTPSPKQTKRAENLRCRRCNKKFSNVGNRNRHVRSDCDQRVQFPCRNPGCKMVATRKAYRDKHEESYCPRKQGVEYQMSWDDSLVG